MSWEGRPSGGGGAVWGPSPAPPPSCHPAQSYLGSTVPCVNRVDAPQTTHELHGGPLEDDRAEEGTEVQECLELRAGVGEGLDSSPRQVPK